MHEYAKKIKGVRSLFLSVLHKTKTPDPFFSDPRDYTSPEHHLNHYNGFRCAKAP